MLTKHGLFSIIICYLISSFSFADITTGCDLPDSQTTGYVHLTSDGKVLYNTPVNISGFQFSIAGGNIVWTYTVSGSDTTWTGSHTIATASTSPPGEGVDGGDSGDAGQFQQLQYNGTDGLKMISFSFGGTSIPITSTSNEGGCGTLVEFSAETAAGDAVDFSSLGFTGLINLVFAGEATTAGGVPPAIYVEYYQEITGCMDDGNCTVSLCGYDSPYTGQPACNYNASANVISSGLDSSCLYPQSYDTSDSTCDGCSGTIDDGTGVVATTDADSDGVCDNFDLCANTQSGETVLLTTEGMGCTESQVLSTYNMNANVPHVFSISQNYPNPFNPTTNISFTVDRTDEVSLIIYDLSGKEVITLVSGTMIPGTYYIDWNAVNNYGDAIASGMYVYRYMNSDQAITKKMLYLK